MRLLIVGSSPGTDLLATKIAMAARARRSPTPTDIEQATPRCAPGVGADLLMVDTSLDIAGLIAANEAERIACRWSPAASAPTPAVAGDAIRAGAKEYIPLPPDAELIAAVLAAVADESHR
jgi:two-component system response regulator FlrC